VGLPPRYPLLDQISSTDRDCTALEHQMYNAAVRCVISWQEKTATIVSFLPTVTTLSQNCETQLLFPDYFSHQFSVPHLSRDQSPWKTTTTIFLLSVSVNSAACLNSIYSSALTYTTNSFCRGTARHWWLGSQFSGRLGKEAPDAE